MRPQDLPALAAKLRPFLLGAISEVASNVMAALHIGEGPGIAITGESPHQVVGLGGDTILLYDSGGDPVVEAAATPAGLDAIGVLADAGDVVWLPAREIGGDHTLAAGVHYVGVSRFASRLTGQITLGTGTTLANAIIDRSASDSDDLVGLVGPAEGIGYVTLCCVVCRQEGSGSAIGVLSNFDSLVIVNACDLLGESALGDGYAASAYLGTIRVIGGTAVGSTVRFQTESLGQLVIEDNASNAKALSLWTGSGNGSPPEGWETPEFDDSGWPAGVRGKSTTIDQGIWSSNPALSSKEQALTREWIQLDAPVVSASINTFANNILPGLYINGNLVASHAYGQGPYIGPVDPGVLQVGPNLVAVHGENRYDPTAFVRYTITLEFGGDGGTIEVHAVEGEPSVVETPLLGDRSAWDVGKYGGSRHASDIFFAFFKHHLPAPSSERTTIFDSGEDWVKRGIENLDLPDPLAFKEAASLLTISVGEVTADQNLHIIAAETGVADDLDTINGLIDRQLLLIRAEEGHTITVKHAVANVIVPTGTDYELSGSAWMLLFYDGAHVVALGVGGEAGAAEFTELSDTPDTYLGNSNKLVAVKESEDGLAFIKPLQWPDFIRQDQDGLHVFEGSSADSPLATFGRASNVVYSESSQADFEAGELYEVEATESGLSIEPGISGDITGEASYAANSQRSGNEPSKAFDDLTGTYWRTAVGSGGSGHWIRTNYGEFSRCVVQLRIYSVEVIMQVKDFIFQGSHDGSSWDTLLYATLPFVERWNTWDLENTTAYSYYRVYCLNNWGGASVIIREIEMLESLSTDLSHKRVALPLDLTDVELATPWRITWTSDPLNSSLISVEAAFTEEDSIVSESLGTGDGEAIEFNLSCHPVEREDDLVVYVDEAPTSAFAREDARDPRRITFVEPVPLGEEVTASYTGVLPPEEFGEAWELYLGGAVGGTFDLETDAGLVTLGYDVDAIELLAFLDQIFGPGNVLVVESDDFDIEISPLVGESALRADFSGLIEADSPSLTCVASYDPGDWEQQSNDYEISSLPEGGLSGKHLWIRETLSRNPWGESATLRSLRVLSTDLARYGLLLLHPLVLYVDTQSNIEALDAPVGASAYAYDLEQPGWFDGESWVWGAGGAVTFLELEDTIGSYSGRGGLYLRVKSSEDGIEAADIDLPETAYAETVGDGIEVSFDIVHNLDSEDVIVQVWDLDAVPITLFEPDIIHVIDADTVRVVFASAPDVDQMRAVIVIGGGGGGGLSEMDILQVQMFM